MGSLRFFLLLGLSINFCGCTGLFYHPDQHIYFPPEANGFAAEDITIQTKDGEKLHGWFFPAPAGMKRKGTIVQFHGNAQNISSHYASLVWATKAGYDLFIFDYRGYGKSSGSPSPEGTHIDALSALDWAIERHQKRKNRHFIVFAQSLGGVIAARAITDFSQQKLISLLVLDSTFYSYQDLAQEKLAQFWLTWIFSPLGQVLVSDSYSAESSLPKISSRTLVIHDRNDPVVGFRNGEKIYEMIMAPKEFWALDQRRHVGVFALDTMDNRSRFLKIAESLP